DGLTFTRLARLAVPSPRPATLQYPHALEHDGHLLVAFSRNKAAIEVLKVPLRDVEALRGKEKGPGADPPAEKRASLLSNGNFEKVDGAGWPVDWPRAE